MPFQKYTLDIAHLATSRPACMHMLIETWQMDSKVYHTYDILLISSLKSWKLCYYNNNYYYCIKGDLGKPFMLLPAYANCDIMI